MVTVALVSTGHTALDHRLFDKEGRALARAGFHVRIVAAHPLPETREGIDLVPLPRGRTRLERFLRSPWRALRELRRHPAGIVHLHDLELLQICPVLKALGQPVVIYEAHEDFANLLRRRTWIPALLRPIVGVAAAGAEAVLARAADAVVAPTRGLADRFANETRLAAYNLPTRDFLERAEQGARPASERPYDIIHLGVLSQARLEFLGTTLELLLARRPRTSVRVVGVTPAQAAHLTARLGPALDVHGPVPYDMVPALVRDCRVGINVHPVVHLHLQVAVPVKVLEYMACGCGVVSSWLPELDALLGETARDMTVLQGVGPERYAEALAEWLDDPVRLDMCSARLRAAVEDRYLWESQASKLLDLYDRLLTAKGLK
jgi:glycosyltransferase involved in cell wall biosynthesis